MVNSGYSVRENQRTLILSLVFRWLKHFSLDYSKSKKVQKILKSSIKRSIDCELKNSPNLSKKIKKAGLIQKRLKSNFIRGLAKVLSRSSCVCSRFRFQ